MASLIVRRLVSFNGKSALPFAGKRTFHSSGTKQMADHGASGGSMYSNDYLHAPHMYDLPNMKQKTLKMGLGVFGSLAFGIAVPVYATMFQMKKAGGV